jgi:hypothetical protein
VVVTGTGGLRPDRVSAAGGTSLETLNAVMLIPEPGIAMLVASGLLALASVIRTNTPF